MKKVYALIVGCFCIITGSFAQTFYWVGPNGANWNSGSNWSLSPGGSAASDYPKDASDNAIFTGNANLLLNTSVDINSLSVTGATTNVKITGNGATDRVITVLSTDPATPALSISAGATLEHSAVTDTWFRFVFGSNTTGEVNGEWFFSGNVDDNAFASFYLGDPGFTTRLNINSGGSIKVGATAFIEPNETTGDQYFVFKNGSKLKLLGNAPVVPAADYAASSTIEITGVTDASVIFEEASSVGNITYNCPAQSNGSNPLYLSLLGFTVKGDVNILGTNNNEIILISFNFTSGMTSRESTIKGKLNIQGNSVVTVAHNDGVEFANNLHVEGDLAMNGTALNIHSGNYIATKTTALSVKGNIAHTGGTISTSSANVNENAHLYTIELDGSTPQTISSHNGNFDNASNQVTLKINNAAGVSLLSDLHVGRLSFNSANKGILSTGSHVITVNNKTAASVSSLPVELAASPSSGYVNGTLRRVCACAEQVIFPVGDASNYRPAILVPSAATQTVFEVKFTNSDHGGTFVAPVRGVAAYFWDVSRIGAGADAAIQLQVPGAIPGALFGHDLAVTRYDGSAWVSTKGTTGLKVSPGTSTSGTVRSESQTSLGSFTISFESDAALPTYLVSFDAKRGAKETADIDWTITDNSTPETFEVQRSADGKNFNNIGSVKGITGVRTYSFTDISMLPGNNYYRLSMHDRDGAVTYSVIKVLMRDVNGTVLHSLAPTMVRDITRAKITSSSSGSLQIIITDLSGRVVQKQQVSVQPGTQDLIINVSNLGSGMFQLTAYNGSKKTETFRFIKL